MGYWGTDPMGGDAPLDLQHDLAEACAQRIRAKLGTGEDGLVFAAAHLALQLTEDGTLGFDFQMFWSDDRLADRIEEALRTTPVSPEWGFGAAFAERQHVSRRLSERLTELCKRNAERERELGHEVDGPPAGSWFHAMFDDEADEQS